MIARLRRRLAAEDGMTLTEMLAGLMISMVVFVALYTFLDVASSNSNQVTARIEANKEARPAMQNIMDKLHSTCTTGGVPPILAGSTSDSISFLHQTGSAVQPIPVKRTVTFSPSNGTLVEQTFNSTGGTAPNWTFSTTASRTFYLIGERAKRATLVNSSTEVPVFRYYAYGTNGQISPTPLPVPLSTTDAARTVQVTVSFAVEPRDTERTSGDPERFSLTDTAILRFTPSGETDTDQNVPCS